jgi:hypothetical protein
MKFLTLSIHDFIYNNQKKSTLYPWQNEISYLFFNSDVKQFHRFRNEATRLIQPSQILLCLRKILNYQYPFVLKLSFKNCRSSFEPYNSRLPEIEIREKEENELETYSDEPNI